MDACTHSHPLSIAPSHRTRRWPLWRRRSRFFHRTTDGGNPDSDSFTFSFTADAGASGCVGGRCDTRKREGVSSAHFDAKRLLKRGQPGGQETDIRGHGQGVVFPSHVERFRFDESETPPFGTTIFEPRCTSAGIAVSIGGDQEKNKLESCNTVTRKPTSVATVRSQFFPLVSRDSGWMGASRQLMDVLTVCARGVSINCVFGTYRRDEGNLFDGGWSQGRRKTKLPARTCHEFHNGLVRVASVKTNYVKSGQSRENVQQSRVSNRSLRSKT